MAAGDFRGGGSVTVSATVPGTKATKVQLVTSLATSDLVSIELSDTAAQSLGDRLKEVKWQVVKAAGQFTIMIDAEQTPELKFDYIVITTA